MAVAADSMAALLKTTSAMLPILWLLLSLGVFRMPADRACVIGLTLSAAIADRIWQMEYGLIGKAMAEGAFFAGVPILWVVLAAFFTYNISLATGASEQIKRFMSGLSEDRRIQALIIAWGFGGFLESVAGFGTAVAVPAVLLIALGFDAFLAATLCLLSNTVAVAFSVVGIPVTTLAKITDLPAMALATDIVLQLTPFVLVVPFSLVYVLTKSVRAFHGVFATTLAAGASFGAAQFVMAKYVGPELPAIIGSLASFGAIVLCAKLTPPKRVWRFSHEQGDALPDRPPVRWREQLSAWSPYLLLLVVVLGTSKLVPAANQLLGAVKTSVWFYDGPGAKPLTVEWLLTPGSMVMLTAVAGGLIQGASPRELAVILGKTAVQLRKTAVTVISIVAMAKVLGYSGMVGALAVALAGATGAYYPFVSPAIGALGTFITGSDTSSNILFGLLQKQTAQQLGMNEVWLAAANTSGGCIGKLVSPQSIAIVAAAAGLSGREGDLLRTTVWYTMPFLLGVGALVYWFA